MQKFLFIDPGNIESGVASVSNDGKIWANKVKNDDVFEIIDSQPFGETRFGIEMVASYGMPVGKTVFDTCVWIGRFFDYIKRKRGQEPDLILRQNIKLHTTHSNKANDAVIRQAMINRWGEPGTKKAPGATYGFSKDQWQALAGATFMFDRTKLDPSLYRTYSIYAETGTC
jgi:hypothetical protein